MGSPRDTGSTITVVAVEAGVSPDQARYWITLLDLPTFKVGRNRCIDTTGVAKIKEMARLTLAGKTPQEAAALVTSKPEQAQVVPEASTTAVTTPATTALSTDLSEIRAAMLTLAQEVKTSREENARLRDQVSRLVERLDAPPIAAAPPKPIRPWEPCRLAPPALPWYRKVWAELFDPSALRALES